jgi:hypothetical protein
MTATQILDGSDISMDDGELRKSSRGPCAVGHLSTPGRSSWPIRSLNETYPNISNWRTEAISQLGGLPPALTEQFTTRHTEQTALVKASRCTIFVVATERCAAWTGATTAWREPQPGFLFSS